MPNWCANRITFSGILHNTDDLRAWIKGEKSSLPGRAAWIIDNIAHFSG